MPGSESVPHGVIPLMRSVMLLRIAGSPFITSRDWGRLHRRLPSRDHSFDSDALARPCVPARLCVHSFTLIALTPWSVMAFETEADQPLSGSP